MPVLPHSYDNVIVNFLVKPHVKLCFKQIEYLVLLALTFRNDYTI